MSALHDGAASSLLLGRVRILTLVDLDGEDKLLLSDCAHALELIVAYLTPHRRHHKITSVVAVADETGIGNVSGRIAR